MEALVRETMAQAEEVGNPRALALCHHALGAVLQLRGRWLDSARAFHESARLCREFDGTFGLVLGEQRVAQMESAVGLTSEADQRLNEALRLARRSDSAMVRAHSLGRIYATLALNSHEGGDQRGAARYLARGLAVQREVGECAGCDVLLYPSAVPIQIAQGELEQAAVSCQKAEETARAFRSQSWVAMARYLVGLLAKAHEDWTTARVRFKEAAEIFGELGQPYEQAKALEELAGTRLAVTPDDGEAGALASQAAARYREVGAMAKADRALAAGGSVAASRGS